MEGCTLASCVTASCVGSAGAERKMLWAAVQYLARVRHRSELGMG